MQQACAGKASQSLLDPCSKDCTKFIRCSGAGAADSKGRQLSSDLALGSGVLHGPMYWQLVFASRPLPYLDTHWRGQCCWCASVAAGSNGTLAACPNGQLFDITSGVCQSASKVQCKQPQPSLTAPPSSPAAKKPTGAECGTSLPICPAGQCCSEYGVCAPLPRACTDLSSDAHAIARGTASVQRSSATGVGIPACRHLWHDVRRVQLNLSG